MEPSGPVPGGRGQPRPGPWVPPASEDADVAEAEIQQRVRDEAAVMTVTARAVHDDRFVSVGLQHRGQGAVVTGEVVAREIKRSRDVSLFEEYGRSCIKDERALAIDG